MNWKSAKRASSVFIGAGCGLAIVLVTAPWSIGIITVGFIWWLIYQGIEDHRR